MSEHNELGTDRLNPTNLDLRVEQIRQGTQLAQLHADVLEIKDVLIGKDLSGGIIMDVNYLKRSSKMISAIAWVSFVTVLGSGVTVLVTYIFA